MSLTPEQQARIDRLTYQQLLGLWRDAPVGYWMFQDEAGDYAEARMRALRNAGADHVAASKAIGWDR